METSEKEAKEDPYRKRIILPYEIPWEYGSNRFASQSGTGGFGAHRDAVVKVKATREFAKSNDGDIPKLAGNSKLHWKPATQSGQSPFGGTKDNVRKVQIGTDTKEIREVLDPETETFLSKWSQPNPKAKNADIGRRRDATTEVLSTRLAKKDRQKSEGILPRLADTRLLVSPSGTGAGIAGFHAQRGTMTKVEGLDLSLEDEMKSKKIMPWTSGPQIMQTQSRTGGFQKPRDVVNQTYYDAKQPRSAYRFL